MFRYFCAEKDITTLVFDQLVGFSVFCIRFIVSLAHLGFGERLRLVFFALLLLVVVVVFDVMLRGNRVALI